MQITWREKSLDPRNVQIVDELLTSFDELHQHFIDSPVRYPELLTNEFPDSIKDESLIQKQKMDH
jgi:hypothetical protein